MEETIPRKIFLANIETTEANTESMLSMGEIHLQVPFTGKIDSAFIWIVTATEQESRNTKSI